MEKEFYTCEYCQIKYRPKKRRIQRFCSDSCRVGNWRENQKINNYINGEPSDNEQEADKQGMTLKGIGEATAGTLVADSLKAVGNKFLPDHNKPATKEDVARLESKLDDKLRYEPILNEPPNALGQKAYFDKKTSLKVFHGPKLFDINNTVT